MASCVEFQLQGEHEQTIVVSLLLIDTICACLNCNKIIMKRRLR